MQREGIALARDNRGRSATGTATIVDRARKVFKMSLGRSSASEDDWIFQDAIAGGYVVLGWGGDVDWSDPRYDDFAEIKARWREKLPTLGGMTPISRKFMRYARIWKLDRSL